MQSRTTDCVGHQGLTLHLVYVTLRSNNKIPSGKCNHAFEERTTYCAPGSDICALPVQFHNDFYYFILVLLYT